MNTTLATPMINRALRLVRVYHDLNQAELAKRLKISKSYLSEIEAGKKKVTLDLLDLYSVEFKIPVSSLMLFAEFSQKPNNNDLRSFVASKTLKMLDWIATITGGDSRR